MISNHRVCRRGGGVGIMIKLGLSYNRRDDLTVSDPSFESICIELDSSQLNLKRDVLICVIYRPPDTNLNSFNIMLSDYLDKLKCNKKTCYIMGDFNVNLLNSDRHLPSSDFLDVFYTNNFFPLITKPTRVQSNSATLIDNIFCNNIENDKLFKGILYTDVSDHFPIFTIDYSQTVAPPIAFHRGRNYCDKNKNKFKQKLEEINWDFVLQNNNVSESFTLFHSRICDAYNDSFPVECKRIGYRNRNQWLTPALKVSILKKNMLFTKSKNHPSSNNIHINKTYRNKLGLCSPKQ